MNEVKFDGNVIRYSDNLYIECIYDEYFSEYAFDIYNNGVCDELSYCILEQAHKRALEYLKNPK